MFFILLTVLIYLITNVSSI